MAPPAAALLLLLAPRPGELSSSTLRAPPCTTLQPLRHPLSNRRHVRRRFLQAAAGPIPRTAAHSSAAPSVEDEEGAGAGRAAAGAPTAPLAWSGRLAANVQHSLAPLSDSSANRKLLALSTAQLLVSFATLLHDTYLPLFLSEELGMSNTKMGNLHALLHFLERSGGVLSGRLTDVLSPARMVIIGTGMTALVCKPLFALCGSVFAKLGVAACITWVTCAKILDRLTKGVREAPSKALVGELAHSCGDSAAAAYSVRQVLATLGMLLGSVSAGTAFQLTSRSYTATFALSVVPALAGFGLVLTALGPDAKAADVARRQRGNLLNSGEMKEEERLTLAQKARALATALPAGYWQALATTSLLFLARFDVAFITVRASQVMDRAQLPMLTLFSMLPVILLAAPVGVRAKASTRARNTVLLLGCLVGFAGDICFAFIPSSLGMALGSTCVGVHMAMTQGVLFGMLASYIPAAPIPGVGRIAGTVWSLTDLALGLALAQSNTLAGRLCDWTARQGMGATGCFLGGALMMGCTAAALLLFAVWGELGKDPPPRPKSADQNL